MIENTPPLPLQTPTNGFKTGLYIGLATFGLLVLITLFFGAFKRYPRGNAANIYSVLMLAAWVLPPLIAMVKTGINNTSDSRLLHILAAGIISYQIVLAFLYFGARVRSHLNGFGSLRGDDIENLLVLLWGNAVIIIFGILIGYFTRLNTYNSRYGRP